MPHTPIKALAVIALGVGVGLADMSMRGGNIVVAKERTPPVAPAPRPSPDQTSPTQTPSVEQNSAVREITPAEAKEWYDKGAIFLDARPRKDSERDGRIPGSQLLGPGDLDRSPPPAILDVLDPEKEVVIYCIGGDCHDSHNLATLLEARGFTKLLVFTDGFPGWVAAGYEVDTSPLPPE
ncbi:MAG: rhodanese-like domain-containing protein [Phycisphaerales bacterium]|nr:rhodanese-like domain-containing protein [Phycisphaerales bacterium]